MDNQQGPQKVKIPATFEREVLSCAGCKYLDHNLVKSGMNPIYTDNCVHETAPKKRFWDFTSNLEVDDNFLIIPGEWCPFKT